MAVCNTCPLFILDYILVYIQKHRDTKNELEASLMLHASRAAVRGGQVTTQVRSRCEVARGPREVQAIIHSR